LRAAQENPSGEGGSAPPAPPPRLAEDQRLDDAIRRAQVPVEYEKIVQRLFNRGAEAPPSRAER